MLKTQRCVCVYVSIRMDQAIRTKPMRWVEMYMYTYVRIIRTYTYVHMHAHTCIIWYVEPCLSASRVSTITYHT